MYQVADAYPGDAAKGADFLSSAAQRTIDFGDGKPRKERVIVTPTMVVTELGLEGRLCLSESTVRHLGALVGLYPPERVDEILVENERLKVERGNLSETLAAAWQSLEDEQRRHAVGALVRIYVAMDGTEHASKDACDGRNADITIGIADVADGVEPLDPEQEPAE